MQFFTWIPTQLIKWNKIWHFQPFYYCKILVIGQQKYICILCVYVRIDCKSFQPFYYHNELKDAVEAMCSSGGPCRTPQRVRHRMRTDLKSLYLSGSVYRALLWDVLKYRFKSWINANFSPEICKICLKFVKRRRSHIKKRGLIINVNNRNEA